MSKIVSLSVRNFRKLKNFDCTFGDSNVVCLIGRGDSGKSTVLDAISYVLSPSWTIPVTDYDFTDLKVEDPIRIGAVVVDFPDEFMRDDKYGMYLSGFDVAAQKVVDATAEGARTALVIELSVDASLEPKWEVVNYTSAQRVAIPARDRAKLNVCLISDYLNRHFAWANGSPLSALSKLDGDEIDSDVLLQMLRQLRADSKTQSFGSLDGAIAKIRERLEKVGLESALFSPALDMRQLALKEGAVCLHDQVGIPVRARGKGARRLVSIAIQSALAGGNSISLIDEVEQGLEPDRIRALVHSFVERKQGQVFFTTHSSDALVEVPVGSVLWMKEPNKGRRIPKEMQGLLRGEPEAFFAKRILLCEGATEVGFCRAIGEYLVKGGGKGFSYEGIVIVDGGGDNFVNYAEMFSRLGVDTLLFCDSDKAVVNEKKQALRDAGVCVVDWSGTDAFEQGILGDLPDKEVGLLMREAVRLGEQEGRFDKGKIISAVKGRYSAATEEVLFGDGSFSNEYREAIGNAAKHKDHAWFKFITGGVLVGKVACGCYERLDAGCRTKWCIDQISDWSKCRAT